LQCDGNTPSCAACASVYGTECIYDPNSDHRRKGVYKKDIDNLKTRNSTLQTLIQAILNYPESEVPELVKQIRTCESLDDVAESIMSKENGLGDDGEDDESPLTENGPLTVVPKFEAELSGKMGELRLENGSVSFIGGTSNLIFLGSETDGEGDAGSAEGVEQYQQQVDPIASWTEVTSDPELVHHLLNMYFTWHYTYFTTLSKSLFYREFLLGKPPPNTKRKTEYCTELLVNAMLALGCHFTSWPLARADPHDSATAGDHFFKEAKRLILENDEHEHPRLATVQALALMSVREAGCGREARGWVYSGMSFRMAYDLGLNVDSGSSTLEEQEVDARRITIWGCFLFDKYTQESILYRCMLIRIRCWSNYLGRQPQLLLSNIAVPKFDVFPMEDADTWSPYVDSGVGQAHSQPSRTRAVALQISQLCEISSDLLLYFYHPTHLEKPLGKQAELKKLGELHTRLEAWRKNLPKEMEPKEGQLPYVLVMQSVQHQPLMLF
jgi:ribosomal protein L13E